MFMLLWYSDIFYF